nr:hypothetical protein [Tanacetum cinerariifolium]
MNTDRSHVITSSQLDKRKESVVSKCVIRYVNSDDCRRKKCAILQSEFDSRCCFSGVCEPGCSIECTSHKSSLWLRDSSWNHHQKYGWLLEVTKYKRKEGLKKDLLRIRSVVGLGLSSTHLGIVVLL